jgi:dihydroorotate dehydrogenase (NAD+) catalytic subunit
MIDLGVGRKISTIVISTALGHDGRGIFPYTTQRDYGDMVRAANLSDTTRISKSFTRDKRRGNFRPFRPWTWKYIQNLGEDGMLNAYDLTNRGAEVHCRQIAETMSLGIPVIPSFFPEFGKGVGPATKDVLETIAMIGRNEYSRREGGFWAIELNFSYPNTPECVADNVEAAVQCVKGVKRHYPDIAIIAKISVVHPLEFANRLREAGADILHSANTVPYDLLFSDKSPLAKVGGGGVSGGPAFEFAFEYNSRVVDFFDGPVILGCGIVDDDKLNAYFEMLQQKRPDKNWSLSVCTAALRRPEWVERKIHEHNLKLKRVCSTAEGAGDEANFPSKRIRFAE